MNNSISIIKTAATFLTGISIIAIVAFGGALQSLPA